MGGRGRRDRVLRGPPCEGSVGMSGTVQGVVAVAAIVGVTVLGGIGTVTSEAVVAIYSAVLAGAGGVAYGRKTSSPSGFGDASGR